MRRSQTAPNVRGFGGFTSIAISVLGKLARRLDAEVYLSDGYQLRHRIERLPGTSPFVQFANVWQPNRLKGIRVNEGEGLPFLSATQAFDIRPFPHKWLSPSQKTTCEQLYVKPGWLLVTRSGSVGDVTIAHTVHSGIVVSDDLLRVVPRDVEKARYLYAFLRTRYARGIVRATKYGNMIKHLEPEHLESLPVPKVGDRAFLRRIEKLIANCFFLRDEANQLTIDAEEIYARHFRRVQSPNVERGFAVHARNVFDTSRRLDAGSFNPSAVAALEALESSRKPISRLSDVTSGVFGVKRFKHLYTKHGTPYLDSGDLFVLNPELQKFIPPDSKKDAADYYVKSGWLLMACSGQVYGVNGNAVLAGKWHEGKIVSNHVIRIVPKDVRSGYLLVALTHHKLGRPIVMRLAFGTEVPEISPEALGASPIPRLGSVEEEIADKIERAQKAREDADDMENEATELMEYEVAMALGDITPEDVKDINVARSRLEEIQKHPDRVLQGTVLEAKLKEWES